jgi:NAD+ kinase
MRLVAKMKICFVSFPLEKNLKAQEELTKIYGNCNPEDADFIVALGGDGFILKSLHDYLKINKPIFGMNFGSVGFLMNEFKTEDLEIRLKNAQLTKLKPFLRQGKK